MSCKHARPILWGFVVILLSITTGPLIAISEPTPVVAQSAEASIRQVLQDQTAAWNRGDIDGFMSGYWESSQTEFVSADGVSHGWQTLLDRYRKHYPDRKAMGRLTFSNLEIHVVCEDAAFATGQYQLERENDRPSGDFTLNFQRFPEGWKIVADHTTAFPSDRLVTIH
ncbi:MAG: YybH family protein [Candidatus Acidiferrales bacterium]